MKNLFNEKDYKAILLRLNSITQQTQRSWGKMDVHQMLVHIKFLLDIALGNTSAEAHGLLIFRTLPGRWLTLYIVPWRKCKETTPKEMNTFENGMIITDFESDKHLLIMRINEFVHTDGFEPHPSFGKIKNKDWGRLAWKHINHHLLQFGA